MKKSIISVITLLSASLFAQGVPELYSAPVKKAQVGAIEVAYKVFGSGAPLLMIAGYGSPLESWDPYVVSALSKEFTVIVFDNRGIGRSTTSDEAPSIELFAKDAADLVRTIGFEKVSLVGWSMGGYIAQEFALNYPELTDKLVLLSTSCGGDESVPPSDEAVSMLQNMGDPQVLLKVLFPADWTLAHPEVAARFTAASGQDGAGDQNQRGIADQYVAVGNWSGTCERLKSIESDTMIIAGTEDIILPVKNSLILAEAIEGSWLVRLKDGGHGAIYQFPERIADLLITFLK
ncbi:MAG TPA: alpha/beta hydrolase [Mesotoga sp.]|nr:alpha/beta hydrolase [Mesotoga sp.]HQC56897.1 alpha/beta hydrolase [Mesotoga sp.]